MLGASFTQWTISSTPIGGSISPEVVVVAIVRVVIIVTIIGVVVVGGGGVSPILKLSFMIIGFLRGIVFYYLLHQSLVMVIASSSLGDLVGLLYSNRFGIGIPPGQGILDESTSSKFHFTVLNTVATRKYRFSSFKLMNETNSSFRTIEVERLAAHKLHSGKTLSAISCRMTALVMAGAADDTMEILEFKISKDRYEDNRMSNSIGGLVFLVTKVGENQMSSGGVIDLTGDEDPTDEDGDTGMDDSTGVSTYLGGEISSRGKKYRESNSDNTGGTTVGEAIGACSGGIGNSLVASYACMTSIYGSSCKGEKTSVAKRYLVKSFEESGEVFPGEAGK
nr:hypothetical protein [Tanacetum cinerariifolium]